MELNNVDPGGRNPDHVVKHGKRISSKLYSDTRLMLRSIVILDKTTSNFIQIGIPIILIVYLARGFANGVFIPYSMTYVIDGLKNQDNKLFQGGVVLLITTALVFVVTEIVQMIYFKKLTRGIASMKRYIIDRIKREGVHEDPEDLVGKISSDVDFVVWNLNAVLTTLLPNLFTAITALYTINSFAPSIGFIATASVTPYILYAEIYSRRVETYRAQERKMYAQSIVYIKNIVYGESVNGDLDKTLKTWEYSINKILWIDRFYFAVGMATWFSSMGLIALLAGREVTMGKLGLGVLSGILYATLTTHSGMLNAMWALCVQGQTATTLKRILKYLESSSDTRGYNVLRQLAFTKSKKSIH